MVVVEIKSAESAKMESEVNKIRIDKELLEKKYKLERDIEEFTQKLSDWVSKEIMKTITLGENYWNGKIYYGSWQYINAPDFDKCMKMLCQIFQKAGYDAYFSYYSRSWQSKSGKVCWISIDW